MTFIPVGQIVAFHGLRGEVKFRYYNESKEAFLGYPAFFVDRDDKKIELEPSQVRLQGGIFIIKFRGFDTREEVRFLLKKELLVAEEDLPALEEGEYYDFQLVGLEALTMGGRMVGRVKDVMHTGATDILVIAGDQEVLVPMTENDIGDISLRGGFVRITEAAFAE
jgi:16S rRNA processing protein RimM